MVRQVARPVDMDDHAAAAPTGRFFFLLFLISGFCSLVYETIWTRLAMAAFGVTTASISIVVSVFMAGLAAGSWLAGRLVRRAAWSPRHSLRAYAAAELLIGLSGMIVPVELNLAERLIESLASGSALGSTEHYVASGILTAAALLPWTLCMGATIPLAMASFRERRSFSYLYLANVLGAVLGTLVSAFVLIEVLGFRKTLHLTAAFNLVIAMAALVASGRVAAAATKDIEAPLPRGTPPFADLSEAGVLALLFLTGFATMAAEVIWIREFTPFLGTFVYSFATILAYYLGATFLGSAAYRLRRGGGAEVAVFFAAVAPLALLPLVAADPRLRIDPLLRVPLGVAPFSALLGYLTPMLIDRWSVGRPERAGLAYAINAVGCILGPLVAGFWLLPALGTRGALVAVALPATIAAAWCLTRRATRPRIAVSLLATAIACGLAVRMRDFEESFPAAQVRRDHTANVIAIGQGMRKRLLVNGISMTTYVTPITKMMAHFPLAALRQPPTRGLVICFGMGTTFRSMRSWNIATTAVELVPSVPALFGYFHPDGPALLASPDARVVIDDGRRFLERTVERFDAIVVDPPPPVEAASSSLLYSREFYLVARRRIAPGGILQQWLPYGDGVTIASVTRALAESFPHVRAFSSVEGWGVHFLASDTPLEGLTADEMARRLPAQAAADLTEWGPYATPREQFAAVLRKELPIGALLAKAPAAPALTDDRPLNEYFWLRRHF